MPFLGVLANPDAVFKHEYAAYIVQVFGWTKPEQLLLPFTIIFASAAVISGLMRISLTWVQTRIAFATGADLSYLIYLRTLYQPYSVHIARNSSEVIAGVSSKANQLVGSAITPVLTIVTTMFMLVVIVISLITIDPLMVSLTMAGFGLIYFFISMITRTRLVANSNEISKKTNSVIQILQEGLGGIREVLIDGTQSTYCRAFRSADVSMRSALAYNKIMSQSPRYVVETLGVVLISILAFLLGKGDGGLIGIIPTLGVLAVAAQKLLPMLQQIYVAISSILGAKAILHDALILIEQPLPGYVKKANIVPIGFDKSIKLNNVSFRFNSDSPWILKGLNLEIIKGSKVGFIGSTGSGKSTLLDVFMFLLNPSEGALSVDGVQVDASNFRNWQSRIAHIPQTIFLSDSSIAQNIAFGQPKENIDYRQVRNAASQAQIASTIESWENQYDTVVGERGVRLSGGQRQRIGIARALYKQANVIILDEATSALDNKTEAAVIDVINKIDKDITILMVAHRLTTLKSCDQIVELEDGIINRIGTYQEMINL